MTTIRQRVLARDRERFLGRTRELEIAEAMLSGRDPRRVLHIVGPGGIGKSALLREIARRAAAAGYGAVWIDGRDVQPFPSVIDAATAAITESAPAVVVIDSYELVSSLDSYLRDQVIPELPESTIVLLASRRSPSRSWYEQGWDTVVRTVELEPLGDDEAGDVVRGTGVTDEADVVEIVRWSRGFPLALVVAAEGGPGGSPADLAARLVGDEVEPARQRVLAVAAIARVTTPELLAEVLADPDPQEAYKWLADRSFSEPLADGVTLHALVADAVREQLRAHDPAGEGSLRRRIADHLHRRALAGNHGLSTELQHLIVDPAVRWGYLADVGHRYRVDTVRPGDAEQVGAILTGVGFGDWWAVTRVFFEQHPELVGVARDHAGRIGGYYVAVAPATAPPAAHADLLLGPWLQHARDELRTTSVVLWREAVDLTGTMGEVTSLLGAGGLISSGVPNPRYVYLPITPAVPAAREFSARLGAVHVAELDVVAHGMHLECHLVDFGAGGLIGNQRDWIYRETGMAPPVDLPDVDGTELLRCLRDPAALTHGPGWLGATPADRLARLRELVAEAMGVFGAGHDDQLARAIIEVAYLGDNRSHESVARTLHLSRSAYFRRLQAATARVGEQLTATLHGPS